MQRSAVIQQSSIGNLVVPSLGFMVMKVRRLLKYTRFDLPGFSEAMVAVECVYRGVKLRYGQAPRFG